MPEPSTTCSRQVLPDENDCVKLFKAVRISKYVAQENIEPLPYPRRCTHRVLPNYFEGYDPITGRHASVTASRVHSSTLT